MSYRRAGPKYKHPRYDHHLIAIDLGKRKVGVAWGSVIEGVAELHGAATVNCNGGPEAMAERVVDLLIENTKAPRYWVCEWPKKYRHLIARHENIEELHQVGYALARCHPWDEMYLPGDWKGNVPKAPHHKRVGRALDQEELNKMPPLREHDAWDAAGIWLYAAGRTRRGGVPV
tara:strand:- start:1095 stop:1616 length:522 start_codon:yes stop_codon:yes gene_type:complete